MSPKPSPETSRAGDLARKYLTVQNVLLVLVTLFQGGQYWERQQVTHSDAAKAISAIEVRLLAAETAAMTTYARRDVLDVTLRSMDARLTAIENLLRARQ